LSAAYNDRICRDAVLLRIEVLDGDNTSEIDWTPVEVADANNLIAPGDMHVIDASSVVHDQNDAMRTHPVLRKLADCTRDLFTELVRRGHSTTLAGGRPPDVPPSALAARSGP
jgi:hypothetical protein